MSRPTEIGTGDPMSNGFFSDKGSTGEIQSTIDFTWGVKIPVRDEIKLNATVYKTRHASPAPAILTLTPYVADNYHSQGTFFASHGYHFVAVDARGRGNSEGEFEPFVNDARDGHDIVEWIAQQPWCDGQVGMWGGSYGGTTQWLTLREDPPSLTTIVPTASAHAGVDFPSSGNIFTTYDMQWLTFTSGVTRNAMLMNDAPFWIGKFQELYRNHLPYKELDRVAGNPSTIFQRWISHPQADAYWDQMILSPVQYDRIDQPILTITGHYDDDQLGAMEFYRQHMLSKSTSKQEHYLVISPWDHPGTRTPSPEFGGLKMGKHSLLDMNHLHLEWYDWRLKNGKKPSFLRKRVAYYVMGEEKWKYADSLETIPTRHQKWYLSSTGEANDVFHSGTLQKSDPKGSPSDTFIYDPLDKRPADLEREPITEIYTNQAIDLNLFGNGLVYHSQQFEKDMEITGWVRLIAWIALDVPDTDFMVTLSEVLPDGRLVLLAQALLRARHRESNRVEKLVVPGEINRYTFDRFPFFSKRIRAGSRLRLIVKCPNTIYLEKNYNSGSRVAMESEKDARTAHVTLYHDKDHPSYLELPVAR